VDVRVLEFGLPAVLALLPIARAGGACRDCQLVASALLALLVFLLAFASLKNFFGFLPIP
jgi:hypothetical protein